MRNLAGSKLATTYCRQELAAAGVPVVPRTEDLKYREVPSDVDGRLKGFHLYRLWYYWSVRGPMPIEPARLLYEDPTCRRDVRAAGHCWCPPPDSEAQWQDVEGRELVERRKLEAELAKYSDESRAKVMAYLDREGARIVDVPAEAPGARLVVQAYHVDSQAGLNAIAAVIRLLPSLEGKPPQERQRALRDAIWRGVLSGLDPDEAARVERAPRVVPGSWQDRALGAVAAEVARGKSGPS